MRDTLHVWLEGTETYVLEVILEQRQGKIAEFVRGFVNVLSRVYGIVVKARRFLYNAPILRVKRPIGNRTCSFWKVLLVALIVSALAGIILAILIPTISP
jgi:hypothetical protein